MGKGKQTRSFCFVSDMVDGLINLMNTDTNEETSLPVNLGNPDEITIKQLADTVISLTNSKSKIEFLPLPQDDPMKRKPDIEKAIKILEWKPKVNLSEGLLETINYFKNIL